MAEFKVTDFKESSLVDAVLSLDVAPNGQDVALTLHFESNTAVRLPMTAETAMRLWALLDQARRDKGWPEPPTPVSIDELQ
jgi:hypothetical protein